MTNYYDQQNQNVSGNQINIGGIILYVNKSGWPQQIREWEYKNFVYPFPKDFMWVRLGSKGYTESGAKLEFWQNGQRRILPELQKWLDQGWEPLGEFGPGCIEIKTYWSHKDKPAGYWVWFTIAGLFTFGLSLFLALIDVSHIAEPTIFIVQMRRPK